jgi:uncharacterized CHY-type Zn-finger protein
MKTSRITKIGMAVVGTALLGWLVLVLFVQGQGEKIKSDAPVDPNRCAFCGRELPVAYRDTGKCPYCELDGKADPAKAARQAAPRVSPIIPIVLVSIFCLLLAIHVTLAIRARWKTAKDEVYYLIACEKCSRRLRYRQSQIGKLGLCPLCKKPLIFPKPEDEEMEGGWSRVRRWLTLTSASHQRP